MKIFLMFLTKPQLKTSEKQFHVRVQCRKDHQDEGDAQKEARENQKLGAMEAAKSQTQTDGDSCLPEQKKL